MSEQSLRRKTFEASCILMFCLSSPTIHGWLESEVDSTAAVFLAFPLYLLAIFGTYVAAAYVSIFQEIFPWIVAPVEIKFGLDDMGFIIPESGTIPHMKFWAVVIALILLSKSKPIFVAIGSFVWKIISFFIALTTRNPFKYDEDQLPRNEKARQQEKRRAELAAELEQLRVEEAKLNARAEQLTNKK